MVLFCGDIHGELKKLIWTLTQKYNIENASVIILGDFGVGFSNQIFEDYKRKEKNLDKNNITLYALRGNHDNPEYFKNPKNYKRLIFLEDHKVYKIEDLNIYTIGGACSIDRDWRLQQKKTCWWEGEGIEKKYDNLPRLVDIIISHEAPLNFDPIISNPGNISLDLYNNILDSRKYLNYILQNVRADYWYYGHYHKSYSGSYNNLIYKGLDIMELKEALPPINHNPQEKEKGN